MDLQLYFGALVLFMVILFIHYLWVIIAYLKILWIEDVTDGEVTLHGVLLMCLIVWFIVMIYGTVQYILQL